MADRAIDAAAAMTMTTTSVGIAVAVVLFLVAAITLLIGVANEQCPRKKHLRGYPRARSRLSVHGEARVIHERVPQTRKYTTK